MLPTSTPIPYYAVSTSKPVTTSSPTVKAPALVTFALGLPIRYDDFDVHRQNDFKSAVARSASVERSEVQVSGIHDVQNRNLQDRRGLQNGGIVVDVIIDAQDMQTATIVASKLTHENIDAAMQEHGFSGVELVRSATAILRDAQDSNTPAEKDDSSQRSRTTPSPIEKRSEELGLMAILGILVFAGCCCCCFFRQILKKTPLHHNNKASSLALPMTPKIDRKETSQRCLSPSHVGIDETSPTQQNQLYPLVGSTSLELLNVVSKGSLDHHQAGSSHKTKRVSADLGLIELQAPSMPVSVQSSLDLMEVLTLQCTSRTIPTENVRESDTQSGRFLTESFHCNLCFNLPGQFGKDCARMLAAGGGRLNLACERVVPRQQLTKFVAFVGVFLKFVAFVGVFLLARLAANPA